MYIKHFHYKVFFEERYSNISKILLIMWGLKGQALADSSAYSKVKEINTINRSTKTIAKCVSDNTDINIIKINL